MSLLVAIAGAVLLWLTHHGILQGRLAGGRGRSAVLASDPNFWTSAAWELGFALVMVSMGLIYLATGYKVLPEIDKGDTGSYLGISLLTIAVTGLVAVVLKFVLPLLYV